MVYLLIVGRSAISATDSFVSFVNVNDPDMDDLTKCNNGTRIFAKRYISVKIFIQS